MGRHRVLTLVERSCGSPHDPPQRTGTDRRRNDRAHRMLAQVRDDLLKILLRLHFGG